MTSVLSVFEQFWYVTIVLLVFYILIILIIEFKDMNYFNFNLGLKKHEYKGSSDWYRVNDVFLKEFKYYKSKSIEDIVKKIQKQFLELIVISFRNTNDLPENENLDKFIENISDKELQFFLKNPVNWVNKIIDPNHIYLLEQSLKKNKKTYKKFLPNLLRIEKSFLKEMNLESFETNMNFNSKIYKQFIDKEKMKMT